MRVCYATLSGLVALLALAAAAGICAAAAGPAGTANRPAPPDVAALEPATKTVDDLYRDEIAASTTPAARQALARKLVKTASDTKKDPAAQYALLTTAQDLAARAGDFDLALKCVDEIEGRWQVDGLKLRADALTRSAQLIRDPANSASSVKAAQALIDEAVHGERFDLAGRLCDAAAAPARNSGNPALAKDIAARARNVTQVQEAYLRAQPALEELKANPGDTAASLAVGKYLCLAQGDWETGLARLAAGSDPVLQKLARDEAKEIARVASEPAAEAELADGWWEYGQTQAGLARVRARLHAAEWYEHARPRLTGLMRLVAEKRLGEAAESEMAGLPPARGRRPARAGVPEVVNSKELAEAQRIIDGIAGRSPEGLKGARTVELVGYHDGTEFHRNSGGTEPIADSYSANPVAGGGGGIWLWGIYEKWPPGKYLIVYRLQLLSDVQGGDVCFCDVPKNGNTIASRRPPSSDFASEHWSEIVVPLLLREPTTIEYRLWTNDHKMAMDRLYVFRVAGDNDRE